MKAKKLNILFSSVGRRYSLIRSFKKAMNDLGVKGSIVGTDINPLSPGLSIVDSKYLVSRCTSPEFIDELKDICRKEDIQAIIPLIDTELLVLARHKDEFRDIGVEIIVSDEGVINICNDKITTYKYFRENNFPTPKVLDFDFTLENAEFPLFVKPANGHGSINTFKVNNLNELEFFKKYVKNPIIQEFINGTEYTLDIFADLKGRVLSVVPRIRLETRAGETNKGKTVKSEKLIKVGKDVVEKLGAIGPVTLQCFVNEKGVYIIEINPRFGGGVPLGIASGADYPKMLIKLLLNEQVLPILNEFKEDMYMLRYEDAIFIEDNQ
ncbi:ATP-grasp domain-containing protein [Pontibacillus litoralis]|uniref:ATP-grasp domain-containing protein n=1 Tax=Pontibacillus litoralis JSM 072002 TaxID=1385512 RepID=A0A0A5G5J8_9BACI|nr:ATP-grasp domain-containing protein [Pontibacillus litoralis]KGX86365.1 hypothetical protein N784_05285 [Pontibacillus litoralis JSM 072002]